MPTPPEWPELAVRLRKFLEDIEKRCTHKNRHYECIGTPYHTFINVYCSDCDEFLGRMG